jgi:hypothetical protein
MNVIIFAVLLSVAQTTAPVPRQAPNNPASTSGNVQKKTKDKDTPTNPTPPPINQDQPKTPDGDAKQQGNDNAEHSVAVSKLPPVSVTKDWTDRFYWAFSGLLVVIGGFQIWLLNRQLNTINRQADIAKNQETQMIQAGLQTERIIAQMKDTALRELRAYVGISKIKLDISDESLPTGAVEIQNFGRTPAYKVQHWTGIGIQSYPLTVHLPPSPATSFSVAVLHPNVKNVGAVTLKKNLPKGTPIGTPQLTIYVYGEVTYEDAFGNERHTKFRFFYGGSEPVFTYQDSPSGPLYGAMRPDTEGNEAS